MTTMGAAMEGEPRYLVVGHGTAQAVLDAYRASCWRGRRPTIVVRKLGKGAYAEVELEPPCRFDATAGVKLDVLLGLPLKIPPTPAEGEPLGASIYVGERPDVEPDDLGRELAAIVEEALPFLHWRGDIGPGAEWQEHDERESRGLDPDGLAAFAESHGRKRD